MKAKLGDYIKGQLSLKNITQADFARALGTSPTNVSRWIKGQIPDFDMVIGIACYLSVDPATLFEMVPNRAWTQRYRELTRILDLRTELSTITSGPIDMEAHRTLEAVLGSPGYVGWMFRKILMYMSEASAELQASLHREREPDGKSSSA